MEASDLTIPMAVRVCTIIQKPIYVCLFVRLGLYRYLYARIPTTTPGTNIVPKRCDHMTFNCMRNLVISSGIGKPLVYCYFCRR